jgi:hypothetical protein
MDEVKPKLLDVAATARYLGWSEWQVRNARRDKRFASAKQVGRRVYWTADDLDHWIRSLSTDLEAA